MKISMRLLNIGEKDGLSAEDGVLITAILDVYKSSEKIHANFQKGNQQQLRDIIKKSE